MEKFKSLLLAVLILLSMVLTYQLWFGIPYLEKASAPRYEYAYFTPPPLPAEVVMPAEIVFRDEDHIYLFRRGEKEHYRLWETARQLLAEGLELENIKSISRERRTEALPAPVGAPALVYNFNPPLPLGFIAPEANLEGNMERITFIWEKEELHIYLEGEGQIHLLPKYYLYPHDLLPEEKKAYQLLPPVLLLDDLLPPPEEKGEENFGEPSGELAFLAELELKVGADIYLPLENYQGAEMLLEKESPEQEKLVRAFFLDLSMARRIEEHDGAIYFTNGEKGLRLYPSGLLEFTLPGMEKKPSSLSYSAALQKSAESQSLYGGWMPGAYLCEASKDDEGYRFIWHCIRDGFPLEGENLGSEMLINEQGVVFYRRLFYTFVEEISPRRPFRPYQEALLQALLLNKEQFKEQKATLLSLKPVYYFQAGGKQAKAVPAWCIHFAETEVIYLHWLTLEQLR